jgi:ferrous iron transport protein B
MKAKNIEDIIAMSNDLRWQIGDDFHDNLAEGIYADAAEIVNNTVKTKESDRKLRLDARIDKVLTSRLWGFPLMFLILAVVLWITIIGANYPSAMLSGLLLDTVHPALKGFASTIGMPW